MKTEGLTKVTFEKFTGGRNAKQVAFAIPEDQSPDNINLRFDEEALRLRPGAKKVNLIVGSKTGPIRGLHRYYRMTGTDKWWLAAAATGIYKITDGGTASTYGLNLTRGKTVMFAPFRGRAYAVNGAQAVMRFLGNTGILLTAEVIAAPASAPTLAPTEVVIDACNATTNWAAYDAYSTMSLQSSGGFDDGAYLRATKVGTYTGNIGLKRSNLNLDLSQVNEVRLWASIPSVTMGVTVYLMWYVGASPSYYYTSAQLTQAGTWTQLKFDISGFPAAQRTGITAIAVVRYNIAGSSPFDFDQITCGAQAVLGIQEARWIAAYQGHFDSRTKYSPASDSSEIIKIDPDNVYHKLVVPRSSNAAVGTVNFYRTQNGLVGPSDSLYYATAVANPGSGNASAMDIRSDALLGLAYQAGAASGEQAPPTGASIIWQHKHRMFYVDPTDPSKLWVSNLNDAETCPGIEMAETPLGELPEEYQPTTGCWFYVDRDNGQRITAGVSNGDVSWIAKTGSSYILYGDTALNFRIQKVSDHAGSAGSLAASACENEVAWVDWANRTVWSWSDANGLRDIGQPVGDLIKGIPAAEAEKICATYHDRRFVFTYSLSANGPREWCEYDFRSGTWYDDTGGIIKSGFMRNRGHNRWLMAVAGGPGDDGRLFFADSVNPRIWKQTDGTCKEGTAAASGISGIYLFKALDFRDSGREHRVRFVNIEAQGHASSPRLEIGFFKERLGNLTGTPDVTVGVNLDTAFKQKRLSCPATLKGMRIQPRLKFFSTAPIAIHQFAMHIAKVR